MQFILKGLVITAGTIRATRTSLRTALTVFTLAVFTTMTATAITLAALAITRLTAWTIALTSMIGF